MKIVLCGIDSFTDPKSWSGTHTVLYNRLMDQEFLYGTINYSLKGKFRTRTIQYLHRKLSTWIYFRRGCRDYVLNKYYENAFKEGIKNISINEDKLSFLHVTDYCIPQNTDRTIMHCVYIDSTIFKVFKYQNDKRLFKKYFFKKYIKKSNEYLSKAHCVFTQNEWTRESMIQDYNIPSNKVYNIGFGINLKPLMEEKVYNNNLLIVLRRGKEKDKGLYILLEAFKRVKKEVEDAKLFVVGTELEKQDGVEFYENYPREKTIELFANSSLYVMPATFEPNGITYIEALSNKSPIIGLNRCAIPEFTGDGKYGFILNEPNAPELASLIIHALKDKKKLKEMGEAGQNFVIKKYQWNTVISNMERIMTNSLQESTYEN